MIYMLTQLVKYLLILFFGIYTLNGFLLLKRDLSPERAIRLYRNQTACMFAFHLAAHVAIFAVQQELRLWFLYAAEVALILVVFLIYRVIYRYAERLIINHMCMLMLFGFTVLARLDFSQALRQVEIAGIAVVISIFVPQLVVKMTFLKKFTWVYAVIGILALAAVLVISRTTYGAHITFSVAGITFQPSEFIKLIFVFYVACMFNASTSFKQILITTVVAALHVGILVLSTDLGAALIFFVVYIIMLYVATRKGIYLAAGLGIGAGAGLAASRLFSHVRTRIDAWRNPFANYQGGGYQVAQAMFAIGTGGWLGSGLGQGMPKTIPLAESDFIFATISEEFGGIIAICLILVCLSCFVIIINVAMSIRDSFYKLIAIGFACVYGIQVFLNIGGVIKCIPSTGLTLPFVSYGGSSIFCTIIMFAIIQGLYIIRSKEGESHGVRVGQKKEPLAGANAHRIEGSRPEERRSAQSVRRTQPDTAGQRADRVAKPVSGSSDRMAQRGAGGRNRLEDPARRQQTQQPQRRRPERPGRQNRQRREYDEERW